MLKAIPPAVLTLYADLAQQVETAPTPGTTYTRTRDGIEYLYAKTPIGATRADLFLGRADDEAAQERAASLSGGALAARSRRQIVRMLRRSGFAALEAQFGRVLDAIAAAGLFERGGVLVGTGAYQMMEAAVGSFLPSPTLMTADLDLAAATPALEAEPPQAMIAILRRADPSFTDVPQLRKGDPPSRFRAGNGYLVDLLTPVRSRADPNPVPLRQLAAGAFPAQQLDWLIEGSGKAVALWGGGVPVRVPAPERYAVHKLILAQRRDPLSPKRQKDLQQAGALIEALKANNPFAIEDALEDAAGRGRRDWSIPMARSLAELGDPIRMP